MHLKNVTGEETNEQMKEQERAKTVVQTLDLNFMGMPGTIASYLVPHAHGVVLVESGPGSTKQGLISGLQEHGLGINDVTDVLLTHIHLDHAGAAGWLAHQGARIYVHPVGAPHMLDPEKLLSSAARIYGEMMDTLWGEFLPVPEDKLYVPQDGEVIEIEGLRFRTLDTPGHANHHYAYIFEGLCFSGDIGGVRLTGPRSLRLPMPPPELNLEKWRHSLKRLQQEYEQGSFTRIAPTHFGIYTDAGWHLGALQRALDSVEDWMEAVMPANPSIEELTDQFMAWTREQSKRQSLGEEQIQTYETANPSWMSPYGIQRYWRKYRSQKT